ncbi:MAG: hypothetical protein PHE83_15535 [Opitutaceae bacterium]|nr:hypothetical protein [Opitutaceae bacterium]
MTPTQRFIFGVVASLLLVLGFLKAAESFDPVCCGDRLSTSADDLGDSITSRLS